MKKIDPFIEARKANLLIIPVVGLSEADLIYKNDALIISCVKGTDELYATFYGVSAPSRTSGGEKVSVTHQGLFYKNNPNRYWKVDEDRIFYSEINFIVIEFLNLAKEFKLVESKKHVVHTLLTISIILNIVSFDYQCGYLLNTQYTTNSYILGYPDLSKTFNEIRISESLNFELYFDTIFDRVCFNNMKIIQSYVDILNPGLSYSHRVSLIITQLESLIFGNKVAFEKGFKFDLYISFILKRKIDTSTLLKIRNSFYHSYTEKAKKIDYIDSRNLFRELLLLKLTGKIPSLVDIKNNVYKSFLTKNSE